MPSLRVIYRQSVRAGRELTFDQPVVKVGRDPSCDVTFDENAERIVSRVHAEIHFDSHGPNIEPTDGKVVMIAGKRLDRLTPLLPGDVVELAGPGGPSFEVQFEPLKPRAVIGSEAVDSGARTLFMMPPQPSQARTTATHPPIPKPEPTMAPPSAMLTGPPMIVSTVPPISAHKIPIIAPLPAIELPPEPPSTTPRTARRAMVLAVFLVVAMGSLAKAWITAHQSHKPAKVAASSPGIEEKHAKPPEPVVEVPPPAPPPEPPPLVSPPDPAIRHSFAMLRRAELADESASPPDTGLQEQVRKAAATYQSLLEDKGLATTQNADLQLVRVTARRLGECDGAIPLGFAAEVVAAIQRFAADGDAQRQLTEKIARGREGHAIEGITDLLTAEGLPPELVLVPLDASGFRADTTSMPVKGVVAKGLWQLLPGEAKRIGLQIGLRSSELAPDPHDERLQFAVESQKVAKELVPMYFGVAAGSKLLYMATYDHGSEELLRSVKRDAGIRADETDPEQVSYWRVYESGALSEATRQHAIDMFVLTVAATKPERFKLMFEPLFAAE